MKIMQARFKELLLATKREGMEDVIERLEEQGFFKAPASTKFHLNYEGGLLEHSMNVCEMALELRELMLRKKVPPSGEIQSAASDKISHSRVCYTNFAAKVIIFFVNLSPTAQILLLYGRFCLRLRPQPLNLTSSCRTSWQPEADSR